MAPSLPLISHFEWAHSFSLEWILHCISKCIARLSHFQIVNLRVLGYILCPPSHRFWFLRLPIVNDIDGRSSTGFVVSGRGKDPKVIVLFSECARPNGRGHVDHLVAIEDFASKNTVFLFISFQSFNSFDPFPNNNTRGGSTNPSEIVTPSSDIWLSDIGDKEGYRDGNRRNDVW
ncbi:hypothetical protein KCU90_g35, partial [Aureobasidium melanogenum]